MSESMLSCQMKCKAEIKRAFDIAEQHFGIKIPPVKIVFSNRMTTSAGVAKYKINRLTGVCTPVCITLSNKLMMANGDTFINQTPAHEAAHIIDAVLTGDSSHGASWQRIMRLLGKSTHSRHSMDVSQTSNRVAAYCACERPHYITPRLAKRLNHFCKNCDEPLSLTKK